MEIYENTRHVFGAKSSPTCVNYALQQTARDNKKQHPLAAYVLERNFYMDDFVKSVKGSEAGVAIYEDLKAVLPKGGFQLKNWLSSSHEVMENIAIEDKSAELTETIEAEPLTSSFLGLQWNVGRDTLEICRGPQKTIPMKITQRVILSFVSSVFDLLGMFSPYTMRMRILLKGIWTTQGQSWDEEVPESAREQFRDWAEEMQMLKDTALPRQYFTEDIEKVQLHVFSDASFEAMCIVAYLRAETEEGVRLLLLLGNAE